jgi:PGF-pre-PGF domain-containing protein
MTTTTFDVRRTAATIAVVLALLVAGAAVGVGGAAAADEPNEPPAAYYGEITVDGAPASSGTTIEAEIDGEVRGSITTQQDGQYGGPNSGDRKLTVSGTERDEGATVEFYVVGDDGNRTLADQTATWSSGAHEQVDLSVQTSSDDGNDGSNDGSNDDGSDDGSDTGGSSPSGGAPPEPSANVTVTDVSVSTTEIRQGETVDVTVELANDGDDDGTYEVQVRANTLKVATETVDVPEGETRTVTVPVRFAHAGQRRITVDGVEGGTVAIAELEPRNLPNGTVAADVQPVVDMEAATNGTVVAFDENVTVDAIVFQNASNGTVTVADLEALPEDVPATPGTVIRPMEIRVPADLENRSATIRLSLDASAVEDREAVRLGRYHDGEWQTLEATSVEAAGGELVYEFETPGFSTFAVFAQETGDPQTPTDTATRQTTDDGTPTGTDGDAEEAGFGTFGVVAIALIALVAVLLAAAGARLYQQNRP